MKMIVMIMVSMRIPYDNDNNDVPYDYDEHTLW